MIIVVLVGYLTRAKISVVNHSGSTVMISAKWRESKRDFGNFEVGESLVFKVTGDTEVVVSAHFPDGRMVQSSNRYSTNGANIDFRVTKDSIE